MAKYGARNSMWAPWATVDADSDPEKLPAYGEAENIGSLNKVVDTFEFVEGDMAGDDSIALYESDFSKGTLAIDSVYMSIEKAAEIHGNAIDTEKTGLSMGSDDNPPYGGYGCTVTHIGQGKKYHQVIFYPKVKAAKPTGETYETRGKNITFAADKMNAVIENPSCRKYKIIKDFETEEEAKTYLKGLFSGTSAVPGLSASADAPT